MESWENKIISDKLDSLHGLPAGYSPDLSSKWEIVAAGLPQQKKRVIPLIIRWSVAAAILVCVAVFGVKISQPETMQTGLSTIAIQPLPSHMLPGENKPHIAVANTALPEKTNLRKKVFTTPAPAKNLMVQNELLPLISDEIKEKVVDEKTDSAIIDTDKLAVTIPQNEISKQTRRRTFQKDFNDGVLVMDTGYSKPANSQFGFKFQLHKSTGDEGQPSRRLQLKQVL